jgi:hypothetical protein
MSRPGEMAIDPVAFEAVIAELEEQRGLLGSRCGQFAVEVAKLKARLAERDAEIASLKEQQT